MTEQVIVWKQMVWSAGFRSKLHESAIADWAIERLKTAKVMADTQLVEDIVGLFDQEVLSALFQIPHCRFLHHSLLEELPASCFAGMEELLLKLIEERSEFIQSAAMPVLAALDPQACVQMLRQKSIVHFHTVSGCVNALLLLDQESQRELLPGFLKVWLQLDLEGHHYTAIGKAVALAHLLELPGLFDMLRPRMNTLTRCDYAWLGALSQGLFPGPSFYTYACDYQEYTDVSPPADFAWLLRRDAPLGDMDELLKEKRFRTLQDKLKRYAEKWPNPLLEFYLRMAAQLNKRASTEAKTMFGLFLTGLRMAAWQSESVSFAHLMLDELIHRLIIDLEEVPYVDEIADQLKAFPRDMVVERITQTLEEQQQNYGVIHLVRALKRLPDAAFARPLLQLLVDSTGDDLIEAAKKALICIGPPAAEHIIAVWDRLDDCQQLYGMGVLELAESGQAVDFLLAQWPAFNTDEEFGARESWCRLAIAHPDQRLLACLEPLLEQGETIVQESFYQLCTLLDYEHPKLDELRALAAENRSKLAGLLDSVTQGMNDITEMVTDTLSLALRCPACGSVGRYDIAHVYMSSEGVEPYIGGDVECKACGASPDFELTAKGKLAMMGELMKVKLCNDEKKSYEGPLVIATFMLYDGRVVSPQQALQHYRSKIKQNPKDLSGWLSLANLFDNLQKHKQAFSHYQECLKLDPICPEAAVNVAIYLDMKKNLPGEAWETLTACLNHHQQWKFYRLTQTTEREFVDELLGCYAELCERLSLPNEYADLSTARFSNRLHSATIQRLAPRAQPHSASKEKVGRNQPCPCGSGRKYKKCCMP